MRSFPLLFLMLLTVRLDAANLLVNPSFETSARTAWTWLAGNAISIPLRDTLTTAQAQHGTRSWSIPGIQTTNAHYITSQPMWLKTNQQYTLSVYARDGGAGGTEVFFRLVHGVDRNDGTWSSTGYAPASGSWTRYSVTHTTTNAEPAVYRVEIGNRASGAGTSLLYLDSAQLEEGPTATAWVPFAGLEMGWDHSATWEGNTFPVGNSPTIPLILFNHGANSSNAVVKWRTWDWFNAQEEAGSISLTLPSGRTVTNLTPSSTLLGWRRLEGWIQNVDRSMAEVSFSVLSVTNTLVANDTGLFGGHSHAIPYYLRQARRMGQSWVRTLSGVSNTGGNMFRWNESEISDNVFTYYDSDIANCLAADMKVLAVVGNGVSTTPAYALSGGFPVIDPYWTNFVGTLVNHYKDSVDYWEIFNEPEGEGGMLAEPELMVDILQAAHGQIKAIDTVSGNVVGCAIAALYLANGSLTFGRQFGSNVMVTLGGSNYIDYLSHHLYPISEYGELMANGYGAKQYGVITVADLTGKPNPWNTETGGNQNTQFENALAEWTAGSGSGGHTYSRQHVLRALWLNNNYCRVAIAGSYRQFQYDGRPNTGFDTPSQFSIFDIDQSLRPMGASYSWMAHLLEEHQGFGGRLGTATTKPEIYVFKAKNGTSVLYACGDLDANQTNFFGLTTTDSANCTFYNVVGNPMTYSSGIKFSAISPIWIVTTSATNVLLSSITASNISDTIAPLVSITLGPIGTPSSGSLTNRLIKWWGQDNAGLTYNWDISTNMAILYRYRLDGGAWSVQSQTNFARQTIGTSGTFDVEATDGAGNISTASLTWPDPVVSTVRTNNRGRGFFFFP